MFDLFFTSLQGKITNTDRTIYQYHQEKKKKNYFPDIPILRQ